MSAGAVVVLSAAVGVAGTAPCAWLSVGRSRGSLGRAKGSADGPAWVGVTASGAMASPPAAGADGSVNGFIGVVVSTAGAGDTVGAAVFS